MEDFFNRFYNQVFPHSGTSLNPLIHILIILVSAGLSWWIFSAVLRRLKKKYHDRPFFEKNEQIFVLIKRAGHYSILILVGIGLLNLYKAPIAEKIFFAFMIILLSSIANSIVNILIPYMEQHLADKTDTQVDDVILDLSRKFSGVIIYATGIILALDVLGLNIMPFVAGAGVAGIAIGFAAKDTLSNLIAGVLLIIDRPFEVGDRIEIWTAPKNSATWGDVIDIGLRATKIKTTDNIVIIIPNNEIMTRDIINYTTITKEIRVRIPIGIAYDADIKKAKALIIKVALELDWAMREPAPKVVVRNFGESAVDLQARIWISEPRRRMDTISHVTDRVKEVFQEEGIEIPYPKRDIYIKKEE
ncbi:MAG: mechanosensitive ion channel family protein [Deltaproteobacteria bacterium]|nr:mechanosensitive ion channel family protein [Deltaproteobacteria bacterium]MBW2345142.1 mechanosensitive ion channel family protein [Deltaproteobacteria bacterium]